MCVCVCARVRPIICLVNPVTPYFLKLVDFGKVFVSVVSQLVVSVANVGYTHAHA